MCEKEKLYRENTKLGQFVIDQYRGMIERASQKNYVSLVAIMINIKNKIDEIESSNAPEIMSQKQLMLKDVASMINQLSTDLLEFLNFTFELRKQDDDTDKYTNFFLDTLMLNDIPFQ